MAARCVRAAGLSTLMSVILVGCKVGPNFVPPHEPVPDHYAGATQETPPDSFWWRQFHDPALDRLVGQASAGNLDLKSAYLRLVAARIEVQAARAQGLPSLNGTASFSREQLGLAGILKTQGFMIGPTTPAAEQQLIASLQRPVNLYELGFDAAWELDLFGKVRRSVEAADAQSAGAVEARNDLLVSLEAEVAQTYLQLRAAQALRQVTIELIQAQQVVADLTQSRHAHGLASEPDVDAARAQLSNLQSQLPGYDQTIAASKHALAVLTGNTPEAFDAEFEDGGGLPALPALVPVGLPASLARRRPDIRNSEAALHAATAQIGVSVASLFPDISLSGTYGLRNIGTGYLFDWQSKFYTYGPSVSIPIFHAGALVANVRVSQAQAAQAALDYRKTVLTALEEVEDGLSSLREDAARTAAIKDTVGADQRAVDVQVNAYRHGVITYISVLTTQLQLMQARQQLAQALLTQSTDLVKLYKALGGGWEQSPDVAAVAR
jgi:NodT family efflux transporter outer membrane factor (OMF) lipoprotein